MAEILMPCAEPAGSASNLMSARLASLQGATIGIVNNSWRCMNVIADDLTRTLTTEFGVHRIVQERISAAQTLPEPRLTAMAEQCDAVVVGIGN